MNVFDLRNASFFVILTSEFLISSLANASCKTSTRGPFPDKNTACSSSSKFCVSFAMFNPANVFPAPGIPVRKHIDFSLFFYDFIF